MRDWNQPSDREQEAREKIHTEWLEKKAQGMKLTRFDMEQWALEQIEKHFPKTPEGHARRLLERIELNILSARDSILEEKKRVPDTHGILKTEYQGIVMELDQILDSIKRVQDGLSE